jgi:predicted permease
MSRRDRDLDAEIEQFVEDLTTRNIERGLAPDDARRAALVEIGGVQQVREATRDTWRFAALETLARDLRYGCRMIGRTPGFALVVVATLGLVIGANATVFSVMHAVMWRPLPYPDAERLVIVQSQVRDDVELGVADAEALDLRGEPRLFDRLGTIMTVDAHVSVDGEMERVPAASATDDALGILGAEPMALGRPLFAATDGGMERVIRAVVISHQLWQRRFDGDPHVIGRHVEINNIDVEVVGVLRPEFRVYLPVLSGAPEIVDVWFPRGFQNDRRARVQLTLARLAPGVSLAQAQARLEVVAERTLAEHASAYSSGRLRLFTTSLHDELTAGVRPALWVLAGAVAFVLLIGCVNVATLMLARAQTRQQEMAVRRALGAGHLRLVRQLFTEAALLGVAGAVLGLGLATLGVELVDWLRPAHLPRQTTISITTEVALFVAAITLVVSIVFGLLPAFRGAHDAGAALRAGRVAVQRSGWRRLQRVLVIAEVALSIVPLVAAGLMLRTFVNLTETPLGFDPQDLITAKVAFSFREFPESRDRARLLQNAIERVRQIPDVQDVSSGGPLPLDGWQQLRLYAHPDDPSVASQATMQSVLPGYLRVTRIPLVAGRDIDSEDIERERHVVVVDERIADRLWPGGAIGRHIALQTGRKFVELEIVGVTRRVRTTNPREAPLPHVFVPFHLWPAAPAMVIRSPQRAEVLAAPIKEAVESLGTRRPVFDILPMQHYVDQSVGDTRFLTLVLVGFAVAAVVLAAIGLYGTLVYLTSLRTQEFGVRMALGATTGQVLRTVAGEGLLLAALGAALGFAGAAATTGLLDGLLYDVTPFDGVTLATVVFVVGVTAAVAAIHPAWRASRVSPTHALRAGG